MRVAAYIRVSTNEQVDNGNSLKEQQERLTAYCVAKGWPQPKLYIDDGYTAKNLKRPAIQKLINAIEHNDHDVIMTAKLDRLCRNLLELLQLVKLFNDHNCSYISSSEGFDTTTAAGNMVLQILGSFAEFERGRISERVRDNMISLAKNTNKALGKVCYGYDVIEGNYVINVEEAQNVKYMFDLAAQGHGPRKIAKYLNDKNILTKQGKPWDQTNVKRLLKNTTLTGTFEYNKRNGTKDKVEIRDKKEWVIRENNHPAIIEQTLFDNVQSKMEARSIARKHADSETYLLTGLIKCNYCGGNMKGSTARMKRPNKTYEYFKYICSSYVSGYGCKHHAVDRDQLENSIINMVKQIAEGSIKNIKVVSSNSDVIENEIKEIKTRLSKLDQRIQKQIEAYSEDLITKNDLKLATERVEVERVELNNRLNKLVNSKGSKDELRKNSIDSLKDITSIDRITAKEALRGLIKQINVEDSYVDIVFKA